MALVLKELLAPTKLKKTLASWRDTGVTALHWFSELPAFEVAFEVVVVVALTAVVGTGTEAIMVEVVLMSTMGGRTLVCTTLDDDGVGIGSTVGNAVDDDV